MSGRRGGRAIELQTICAKAVSHCPDVTSVMVFSYPNTKAQACHPKEVTMDTLLPMMRPYTPPMLVYLTHHPTAEQIRQF